jgi:hypothetical protein
MKFAFDVHIEPHPLDAAAYGTDTYLGYVTLANVTIYTITISDPHGPTAHRDMRHEVARSFANHLMNKLG